MKRADVQKSRFLRKEDIGAGAMFTIRGAKKDNVAMEDKAPDLKLCVYFEESTKPLVLNLCNFDNIVEISGKDDSDNWGGVKVFVYFDSKIMFEGKQTGGLRIRAAKDGDKAFKEAKSEATGTTPPWAS